MIPGINQWSLPVGEQDLLSVLRHSVKSKMPNIELCIQPVDARDFGDVVAEPELDDLFQRVARAVNAKQYLLKLLASKRSSTSSSPRLHGRERKSSALPPWTCFATRSPATTAGPAKPPS